MTETRTRSLVKAISYRAISSLLTGSMFFGATQRVRLALALVVIDSATKIVVFYLHERAWTRIVVSQMKRSLGSASESQPAPSDLELSYGESYLAQITVCPLTTSPVMIATTRPT